MIGPTVFAEVPETASIFQITGPTGGFGGMVTKPWSDRSKTAQQLLMETMGPLSKIPGIRVIPLTPPALPGGGDFPVDLVIASAAEPQQLGSIAKQLVEKAFASGLFIFADADLKWDQPQAEVVFDRDKLRAQGVSLSQAGLDLATLLGGDYVNRFSIQGRSYKVIPQIRRADRLTPDQLEEIYITGSDDELVPLSTFADLRITTQPRELKKFQQLNAVRIQGVIPPPVPLDMALGFLENEARAILPQGFTIDYAGESRQLRTEGSRFVGTLLLSAVLIFPVFGARHELLPRQGRYLAPLLPLLFIAVAAAAWQLWSGVGRRLLERGADRRVVRGLGLAAAALLVLLPLVPLQRYYGGSVEAGQTNDRFFRLLAEIEASRRSGEFVVVDDRFAQESLGGGGTTLRTLDFMLTVRGIPLAATGTGPIVPVLLGSNERALEAMSTLRRHGILAQAIRPPTVPAGSARLRLTVHADWPADAIERLVAALEVTCVL